MHASAAYILFVQRSREERAEFATKAGEKTGFFPFNSTDFKAKFSAFLPILWKTHEGQARIS